MQFKKITTGSFFFKFNINTAWAALNTMASKKLKVAWHTNLVHPSHYFVCKVSRASLNSLATTLIFMPRRESNASWVEPSQAKLGTHAKRERRDLLRRKFAALRARSFCFFYYARSEALQGYRRPAGAYSQSGLSRGDNVLIVNERARKPFH